MPETRIVVNVPCATSARARAEAATGSWGANLSAFQNPSKQRYRSSDLPGSHGRLSVVQWAGWRLCLSIRPAHRTPAWLLTLPPSCASGYIRYGQACATSRDCCTKRVAAVDALRSMLRVKHNELLQRTVVPWPERGYEPQPAEEKYWRIAWPSAKRTQPFPSRR